MKNRVDVAVGVIFNGTGEVLVAQRLSHQHLGECWEFPGGKVEPGESIDDALKRELLEEVGIEVISHEAWMVFDYDYPEKSLTLHVHKITQFQGEAQGLEGQPIQWMQPVGLLDLNFPNANYEIREALLAV
jgi:8-oxo-dGTP diphosphatase